MTQRNFKYNVVIKIDISKAQKSLQKVGETFERIKRKFEKFNGAMSNPVGIEL